MIYLNTVVSFDEDGRKTMIEPEREKRHVPSRNGAEAYRRVEGFSSPLKHLPLLVLTALNAVEKAGWGG